MRGIRADTPLLRRAGALAESENLRAHDAIHRAAAEQAAHALAGLPFRFVAFDEQLNRAAAALGLSLIE